MSKTKSLKVVIFTTPSCSWCRTTKRYLREKGIRFHEVDITRDKSGMKDMVRRTGQSGVPVTLVNNRPVIGFDRPKLNKLLGIK